MTIEEARIALEREREYSALLLKIIERLELENQELREGKDGNAG